MQYHNRRTYNTLVIDLTTILGQILRLLCKSNPLNNN